MFDDEEISESEDIEEEIAVTEEVSEYEDESNSEGIIEKGSYVTYRKPDGSTYENEMKPDKFPLHKKFIGKKVGDEVEFMGKTYFVVEVL